ncbi:MAG: caspase family protein [Gammaproteobacteria bacterium]|nr:caspase family protein [Gammaproteobacteria bacterium]
MLATPLSILLLFGLVLLQSDARSDAGDKIALVIGNSDYAFSPLVNPTNDAADMGAALEALGFEVTVLLNADQRAMKRAIDEFGRKLDRDRGTGLFYFAGHGVQVRGRNYLVPVNARIRTENDVEYESVDAGRVLAKMEDAGNELNIVILDACRNNPFARSFRSARNGLASIDAPSGSLIAYATAPGSVAADGSGRNGLYTANLLRAMQVPGLGLEQVFKRVRVAVREATDGLQTPWENTSLEGDFYFIPPERRVATQQPASRQAAPVVSTPVDRQPQSAKVTDTAQPPAPDGGKDGPTLVNVTSNGTLVRARIEVYKSGTEQRVLWHDTSSTDPARNPARLELATGDYDVNIAPLEINGSEPREISNLRVRPGATSTLDVEFPYGVLKFSGLVNGALGLTRLEVFHAGTRQQVLWLDTSDTDKNRNPLQIKLAPGDYDFQVTAMRVLGSEPRLLQNVSIIANETRSLTEDFELGTLSVLATANGKLTSSRVEIFEAGTRIQVSWGDTSDQDKKRNPLPFRLAPKHYDVQVSALNLAGSEPILIEGVRLDARAEETLTAAF